MQQYDDQFKILMEINNEYVKLLPEDIHEVRKSGLKL